MMAGANGIRSAISSERLRVQIELPNFVVQLVAEQDVVDAPLLRQAVELDLLAARSATTS